MLRLRRVRQWLGECMEEGSPLHNSGSESKNVFSGVAGQRISFLLEDTLSEKSNTFWF